MKAKKEKPTPASWRVYLTHRELVKKKARVLQVSEAETVRRAIESFCKV